MKPILKIFSGAQKRTVDGTQKRTVEIVLLSPTVRKSAPSRALLGESDGAQKRTLYRSSHSFSP